VSFFCCRKKVSARPALGHVNGNFMLHFSHVSKYHCSLLIRKIYTSPFLLTLTLFFSTHLSKKNDIFARK
ncbi:MAG: hypothetical protein WCP69_04770, partial [Bacteroidota bacterium]